MLQKATHDSRTEHKEQCHAFTTAMPKRGTNHRILPASVLRIANLFLERSKSRTQNDIRQRAVSHLDV